MTRTNLTLGLAIAMATPMALFAEDAAPAAAATAAPAAAPAAATIAKLDAPGSLKKGNALLDEGKYAEAAAWYEGIGEQVASKGNTKREPFRLNNWALAEIGLGNFEKAAELAQKSLHINSNNSSAWNNLASAQAQSGKRDKAIETINQGIESLKAAGADTSKLEANLVTLKDAAEAGKPKAQKTAEAKAAAAAAAAAPAAETAPAAAPAAADKK